MLQLFPAEADDEVRPRRQQELSLDELEATQASIIAALLATWLDGNVCTLDASEDASRFTDVARGTTDGGFTVEGARARVDLTGCKDWRQDVVLHLRADCQALCSHPGVLRQSVIVPKQVDGRCAPFILSPRQASMFLDAKVTGLPMSGACVPAPWRCTVEHPCACILAYISNRVWIFFAHRTHVE